MENIPDDPIIRSVMETGYPWWAQEDGDNDDED